MNSRSTSTRTGRLTCWCKAGLLGGLLAFGTQASAQYAFSFDAVTGIYTNIATGTDLNTIEVDDAHSGNIPLGFTFVYNGANVTDVRANSNGWLSLQIADAPTAAQGRNNSIGAAVAATTPALYPLWDDLNGTGGVAKYETTGSVGSRVFTMEWRNWRWDWNAAGPVLSFQVKLYETTNTIEFIYRQEATAVNNGSSGAAIGHSRASGAGNFHSLNNSGATPTSSTTVATNNISAKPANNQVYRWTPCNSSVSASASPAGPFCGAASTTLTATGPGTITWSPATGLSGTSGAIVTCTATSTTTYTVTATDGGCVYTNTVTVTVNPAPEISATTATPNPICFNGDSDLNVVATGEAAPFAGAYCASTHSSGSCGFSEGDKITLVVLGTLSNASGCVVAPGYADFTSVPAPTINTASNPHTVSITVGPDANQFAAAWIDFNHDGDFDDADEFLGASGNVGGNGTANIVFTIPPGALNGVTRMRVIGGNDTAILSTQSCGASSSSFGDTEDYNVRIAGASSPAFTYLWTPNTFLNADNIANPEATNVNVASIGYSVLVTHPNGCTATGNVTLNTSAPITAASITGNLAYCAGGFTTLTAVPADGGGPFTYLWSPGGEVTSSIDASSVGNYSCQVTDNCGGSVNTGNVSVTENPLPVVTCPGNSTACLGEAPFALAGGAPGGGTYSGPGVSGGNFDAGAAGLGTHTITYSFTDGNGCTGTCTFDITVDPAPTWYADNDADGFGSGTPSSSPIQESFNSLAAALGGGWAQQNLSTTIGTQPNWFQGNDAVFPANSGPTTAYAAANFQNTTGANTISNWLFTPEVLLQNGAVFSFYTREATGNTFPDRLQVRMSTNGASVNAGANATSVGDFTTLLLDINPTLITGVYPQVWTLYTVTLSGLGSPVNGRFAFRYFVTNGGPSGANSNYIGIDDVNYTIPAEGILVACTQPGGYVANNTDCNDAVVHYTDDDGDGFGVLPTLACGTVTNSTDCDDTQFLYADNDNDTYGAGAPAACGVTNNDDCNDNDDNLTIEGNACDAGPGFVIGEVISCACVGQVCTTDLTIEWNTDGNPTELAWELRTEGTNILVQSGDGSGIPANAVGYPTNTCLPDGTYYLVVTDSGGDGITGGGYNLRVTGGARIIANTMDNQGVGGFTSGSNSQVAGGLGFSIPVSGDNLISTSCDKQDWIAGQFIVANANPAVSAEWVPNAPNNLQDATTGYVFWFYNPNGGYSFRRFRSHATSDGFPATGPTRACHTKLNNWAVANHIPVGEFLNVKIRSRVNGTNFNWGPACRFVLDPVRAACPLTNLMDIPGNQFYSCGVTKTWGGNNRVHAVPVSGATQYQFRFYNMDESIDVTRTTSTYYVNLNWTPALPNGSYSVEVRAFKNGNWCIASAPWGKVCQVNIVGSPAAMGGNQNMPLAGLNGDVALSIFPNPNNGEQLTVSLSAVEEGVTTVAVDLFDLTGARVSSEMIAVQDGFVFQQMDMNGLASGVYMMSITAGSQRYTERLVIQK